MAMKSPKPKRRKIDVDLSQTEGDDEICPSNAQSPSPAKLSSAEEDVHSLLDLSLEDAADAGRFKLSVLARALRAAAVEGSLFDEAAPAANLKELYSCIIDPDTEAACDRSGLRFPDNPGLRNSVYYSLARETGFCGVGVQAAHPAYVRSAVRAAFSGAKGEVLPDSCEQAFQDEVNPSAGDAAALAASILVIEAATDVPE